MLIEFRTSFGVRNFFVANKKKDESKPLLHTKRACCCVMFKGMFEGRFVLPNVRENNS